jgi:hypothetical protein
MFFTGISLLIAHLYWNIPTDCIFCTGISLLTEYCALEYPYVFLRAQVVKIMRVEKANPHNDTSDEGSDSEDTYAAAVDDLLERAEVELEKVCSCFCLCHSPGPNIRSVRMWQY